MKHKPITLMALVLALCITAAAQQLSVENPSSILLDGEFTANVTASGCNITGIEFTLAFDGSVLTALNVTQGGFFSGATMTVPSDLSGAINEGRVSMGIALKEGQACGNGTLVEVRFEGTSAGESDLRLENVTITDEEILPVVNFSLVNSSVSVSSPTTTTVPTTTVPTTTVPTTTVPTTTAPTTTVEATSTTPETTSTIAETSSTLTTTLETTLTTTLETTTSTIEATTTTTTVPVSTTTSSTSTTSTTSTTTSSTSTTTLMAEVVYETVINATANESVSIDIPGADMSIDISVTESIENATITVWSSTHCLVNTSLSCPGLDKYVRIEVSEELQAVLNSVLIRIHYTDEEVAAAGLEEESLSLYHYNPETDEWERLTSEMDWVYGAGVNVVENYIWANVTHFSDYAVGSALDQEPPEILDTNPEGTIKDTTPTLEVETDEQASCRYDSEDRNFSEMGHEFSTDDGILHQDIVSLSSGSYVYYARCNDSIGNANNVSATIEFKIIKPEMEGFSMKPAKEAETICKPDGEKNYKETGVDCGGPCGPCPETTVVTTSLITTLPTTSVSTTTAMVTTTIITTTTIPSSPGIIGSVIALSQEWGDEFSIVAVLLLLSATGYVMKKGRGKRKGQCSLSMV